MGNGGEADLMSFSRGGGRAISSGGIKVGYRITTLDSEVAWCPLP